MSAPTYNLKTSNGKTWIKMPWRSALGFGWRMVRAALGCAVGGSESIRIMVPTGAEVDVESATFAATRVDTPAEVGPSTVPPAWWRP